MNRTEKNALVEGISERLAGAPLVVLADYRGVNVPQLVAFREHLRKNGVGYQVVKNNLAKRAIEGTELEGLGVYLDGMTGWVISGDDPKTP